MRALSISRSWEESRRILTQDGKLFVSVALALIAFPTLVAGLLNPRGVMATGPEALWLTLASLVASLIALAGQLALIRLAIGPSTTVGAAIVHGLRRMRIYLVAAILIVIAFFICAIPIALVLQAMGVPLGARSQLGTAASQQMSGPLLIGVLLYLALIVYVGVRMMLTGPVASAEQVGPIAMIRRSWQLSKGNFWRLLGFLLLFIVAAGAVILGIGAALGVITRLVLGPIEPMSVSAIVVALVNALLNAAVTTLFSVMIARMYLQLTGGETASGVPTTGI